MPSEVPQGTKLGPWLFLVLINDLYVDDLANVWKYVDDTTASEVVAKGNHSCAQDIADKVAEWSMENTVKLNSEKCKELRITFVKNEPQFAPIVVEGKELERVTSAKLLGLTISVFVDFRRRYWCTKTVHQYGVSTQSSTKVRETFRQKTQKRRTTKT